MGRASKITFTAYLERRESPSCAKKIYPRSAFLLLSWYVWVIFFGRRSSLNNNTTRGKGALGRRNDGSVLFH